MSLAALVLVGVVVGAAGVEILHRRQPELVRRIEASAKNVAKRLFSSESSEGEFPRG
mgnify:CR=1 FL=1